MKKILAIVSLFASTFVLAQPANDNCSSAQALGSLPTPAACPSGAGNNLTVTGTVTGATAANPYTYQGTGCTGTNTSMTAPALDVWYTFVATGYQLNLTLNSSFANPNVAVYSGTCASLGGGVGGCAVGTSGGSATLTVYQMVIGQTYYVQVSSNSTTSTGTFTMSVNNSIDCNNCLGATNLTVTPPPTNGMYAPGTTVNFCFKINSYTQVNTNWLHGVQLAFGSGWNLGSLTTTSPPPCQGSGYWSYYPNGITDNSGQAWPAGFYFETVTGANNPGDNFGDNCSGTISAANWNFCFSIKTATACNPGSNLGVTINTSGDGESGSWSSLGCAGDPATVFNAIGACCPPTMASTPVSCNGGADGTTTATPVGTQSPFTYTWSPSGGNSATATNLPAGTYTVSVIDKNNCLATNTVTVTQPTAVTLTVTPTNASCGVSNGSVTATAAGGTPSYSYNINGGTYQSGTSFTGLGAGTYTVGVKDSKGCIKTATVTISAPSNPTVTVNSGSSCNGGSVVLTASGATSYSWSPGTGLSATTGSTVTSTPGSTTIYTVTGTTGGCSGTATSTVTVIANPTVTVNTATICVGQQTATLTASGANTYSWTPSTGLSATSGSVVTATPGSTTTYTINGTAGTCTAVSTTTVTVNPLPVVTVNSGTICIGQQTATLTANGASTYSWNPSTGLSSSTGSSVTANPANTTNYTVTGTSAAGCVSTATTAVTVNPLPTVNVTSATICSGGSAGLTASGASTYTWSPGTGLSATTGSSVTANPTTTTNYTVTGTSSLGCINTGTTSVTVVSNPSVTVASATICVGNSTTLNASGSSTYTWSPSTGLSATTGSTVSANPTSTTVYTITGSAGTCTAVNTTTVTVNPLPTVTVNSSTICVGQQTATLTANGATSYAWNPSTGLSSSSGSPVTANPGSTTSYTVTGTSVNGCTNTAVSTVVVNPLPIINVAGGLICAGTSMTLSASGATSYSWVPGTGLSSTSSGTVTASPASTTQYTVVGVDANGCVNGDTATVTVVNNPTVTATTGTICIGQQTATLTASGASTYVWSPGTGLSSTSGTTVTATPGSTTTYTVTGTVGTCTASGTTTVTVNPLPTITATSGTICVGQQTATLTANGGVSYSWNPSTGLSGTTGPSVTANPGSTTAYTVTGTDANGCVSTATTSVLVNPLPTVTANSGSVCAGASMTLTANGASSYSWNPSTGLSGTTGPSVTANPATTSSYTVTGTDNNGCFNTGTCTVTVVNNPTLTVTTGTICAGQGTATLTASGASTYTWSPPTGLSSTTGSSVNANPPATQVYTITGTAVTSCTAVATTTVNVSSLPNVTANSNSPVCVNQTLNLMAGGATMYGWSGPNTYTAQGGNQTITGVTMAANGTYTVVGVDAAGCMNTATVSVIINPLPVVTATGATVCTGQTINLFSTPSNANSYSWSGPNGYVSNIQNPTIPNADPTMVGAYVVTVIDPNNCANANVAQVVVNPLPVINVNSGTICNGQTTATLTATGANSYVWSPTTGLSSGNGATVIASPNVNTTYVVTGMDVNGCSSSATATVIVNTPPAVNVSPKDTSGCAPVCVTYSNTTSATGTYSWNFGDGTTSQAGTVKHCFLGQGSYNVSLTMVDSKGCVGTSSTTVNVYPVPHADFNASPQPASILEASVQFYNTSSGAVITTNSWTFGDNSSSSTSLEVNPAHLYGDTGSFVAQLVVISDHGCKDSTVKIIRVDDEYALYVPNAFSPNSDGVNDFFKAYGTGIDRTTFNFWIFDRWGNQVWYSADFDDKWDGRMQGKGDEIVQEDVYVWMIRVNTIKGQKKTLSGTVSLLK